jgi:hypothetical protein
MLNSVYSNELDRLRARKQFVQRTAPSPAILRDSVLCAAFLSGVGTHPSRLARSHYPHPLARGHEHPEKGGICHLSDANSAKQRWQQEAPMEQAIEQPVLTPTARRRQASSRRRRPRTPRRAPTHRTRP